jgi:Family of unknown function (DUF6494)
MTAELDEDRFNMAIRKFLKHVGVTSKLRTWCVAER